jgi:hypothetical protein
MASEGEASKQYSSQEEKGGDDNDNRSPPTQKGPIRVSEYVKSAGLVFSEKGEYQFVLSKPKIMAIKSRGVEEVERKMIEEVVGREEDVAAAAGRR